MVSDNNEPAWLDRKLSLSSLMLFYITSWMQSMHWFMAFIFSKYWKFDSGLCLLLDNIRSLFLSDITCGVSLTSIPSPTTSLYRSHLWFDMLRTGWGFLADFFLYRQEFAWAESTQEALLTDCREKYNSKTHSSGSDWGRKTVNRRNATQYVSSLESGGNENTNYYVSCFIEERSWDGESRKG